VNTPSESQEPPVGARIRAARLARGLTQAELAAAVGVTRSAVAQWETERAGQVRGNLSRVAQALAVSVSHLLDGEAAPFRPEAPCDATEQALLNAYRDCRDEDRALLLQTAVRLARAGRR
jgi:transcriptional regulator with XRE-family HTH domain